MFFAEDKVMVGETEVSRDGRVVFVRTKLINGFLFSATLSFFVFSSSSYKVRISSVLNAVCCLLLLRNKKQLANKIRGVSEESPGGSHTWDAIIPRILRDNITRGSKEFGKRVKILSQEFDRTKSRFLCAL